MKRRKLETLLLTLESTPSLLARAAVPLTREEVRWKPQDGGFSLLENIWHLADLEREAFGVRIRRILSEEEPTLSNFDGERIARHAGRPSRRHLMVPLDDSRQGQPRAHQVARRRFRGR